MKIHFWYIQIAPKSCEKSHQKGIDLTFSYLSIDLKMDFARRQPPITRKVSTAIGLIETKADHQVLNHCPLDEKSSLFIFGKARVHPYRWPIFI